MSFRYKILFCLLLVALVARGEEYCYPMKGVKGLYSASYGEMRPNHFHSGVDIRTDGVEGKAVVAVADGYVSRIAVAPTGYGLAIYVAHPDKETMSVYAHLSRLRKDIADYLVKARYERKLNRLDVFPDKGLFPVMQGDTIAYSGNSGSSFGPHLHFEMRDIEGGQTLNPIQRGVISPKDTIPPRILKLHYVALESLGSGERSRVSGSYTPRYSGGKYVVDGCVEVGAKGYFVVEVRDNRNGSSNRFGIYRATMAVDGTPRFEYSIDRFAFADTRHCNVVSFYPLQRKAKCEVLRLAKLDFAPDYLYNASLGDGVVECRDGEGGRVAVAVEDECGNATMLEFAMVGKVLPPTPNEEVVAERPLLDGTEAWSAQEDGFSLFVPRGALYEVESYEVERVEGVTLADTTLVALSPFYRIFNEDVAFNKAVKVHFNMVESPYNNRACVATIDEGGKAKYLGGEWRGDGVEVVFRRGGVMAVVADVDAPTIRPRFKSGADMRGVPRLVFNVKDNFSKVRSYALYIDDEWRSVEYQPIKGEMVHRFDCPLRGSGVWHKVRLEVEDCCGNKGVWQGEILK